MIYRGGDSHEEPYRVTQKAAEAFSAPDSAADSLLGGAEVKSK